MRVCEGIEIDDGTLSVGVLKRATLRDMPDPDRPPVQRDAAAAAHHRQIEHFDDVTEATVTSISEDKDGALRPFPSRSTATTSASRRGRTARRPRRADRRRLSALRLRTA